MDADGLTFACATTAEERVAKRLGLDTVRVGLAVANGVPEGRLVSFGVAGSLGGLAVGEVLDATRVVDENGATLWEGPGLGVRGARPGTLLGARGWMVPHTFTCAWTSANCRNRSVSAAHRSARR